MKRKPVKIVKARKKVIIKHLGKANKNLILNVC